MKEKPVCMEQGQKLAKEVMELLQNFEVSINDTTGIIKASAYFLGTCWLPAQCGQISLLDSLKSTWGKVTRFTLTQEKSLIAVRSLVWGSAGSYCGAGFPPRLDSRPQLWDYASAPVPVDSVIQKDSSRGPGEPSSSLQHLCCAYSDSVTSSNSWSSIEYSKAKIQGREIGQFAFRMPDPGSITGIP